MCKNLAADLLGLDGLGPKSDVAKSRLITNPFLSCFNLYELSMGWTTVMLMLQGGTEANLLSLCIASYELSAAVRSRGSDLCQEGFISNGPDAVAFD
ncbi:hypothetical protein RRG08_035192 [Elysia crispata]|uniref:Uncharacterized protein n=1 Tax=Elysia crispata TaxID=231223 RepID=A0AAE1DA35_9GAST|nr:hypothetical protein RRG08_035192 [Elysia crispata]